ncbi:helix-hairpin-helix domain-containing protein [Cupriavidus sp. BIS7]|uniref:helix-hairpin-helix domain-containing protein n=1 Tax=Cupriavidus sp. BIS7 TaxID=1217718 RepID=UPI00037DD0AD
MRAVRLAGVAAGLSLSVLAMNPAYADVDVNSADETALATIKGIGPATARRIAEERDRNGAFKDGNDLADRVAGVGPKSVANLQAAGLTFGKAAPARKDAKPAPKAAASR